MNVTGSGLLQEITATVDRWSLASGAAVEQFTRQRLGDAAALESRRLVATAQAELANRAMVRFVELLYDADNGRLYNIRSETGRILIPMPWSRSRCYDYGLTDHAGRILRSIVTTTLASAPARYRWLSLAGGQWHVDLVRYPTQTAVSEWLTKFAITSTLWLTHADALPRRGRNAG